MVTINIHDSAASTQQDKALQVSDAPSPQGTASGGNDNAAASNSDAPAPQNSQDVTEGNTNCGESAPSPSGMGLAGESSDASNGGSQQEAGSSGPPPSMEVGGNSAVGSSSPEPGMQMGSQEGSTSGKAPSPSSELYDDDADGKKNSKDESKKK